MINKKHLSHLVWIDLEMSGLNPEVDVILEIATIITDNELNVIAQGPSYAIWQPDEILNNMNSWCTRQHGRTGLIEEVRNSDVRIEKACDATINFVKQHCLPQKAVLAGNSIWVDRMFLQKYMPNLVSYLHYRLIDVSSVKELVQRWYPNNPKIEFKKGDSHRALDDVQASIEELAHYRKYFFINQAPGTGKANN